MPLEAFLLMSEQQELIAAYERYADDIFRFCLVKTHDRALAQDMMQETFIKVWKYFQQGKEIEHLKALLYRIAQNLIIDHSRKRKPDASVEKLMEVGWAPSEDKTEDQKNRMDAEEAIKALEFVKEEYREVLELKYLQDLSTKEIAAVLNINANLVSVRLNRGLKQLRKYIPDA